MTRRLRSLNGCDRCRSRRKKCDEKHPTCEACSRHNAACTWLKRSLSGVGQEGHQNQSRVHASSTSADSQSLITTPAPLSCHQDGLLANGYRSFSDDCEFKLASTCPPVLSHILCPFTTGQESDTSRFTSLVFLDSSVRAAWLSFAARVFTLQDSSQVIAQKNYSIAVASTRRALKTHRDSSRLLPLIAAMLFMGMTENISGGDDPDFAFIHNSAILILVSNVLAAGPPVLAQSEGVFLQLSVECALFVVAHNAMYQPDLIVFQQIDWSILNNFLNDASISDNTFPYLRGRGEVFSTFCQVAALAREPDSDSARNQLAALAQRLDHIESHWLRHGHEVPVDCAKIFSLRWPLVFLTIRICLTKVSQRTVCSGTHSIRALVDQSLIILSLMEIGVTIDSQEQTLPFPQCPLQLVVNRDQGMFWHISTLMNAIHEIELIDLLKQRSRFLVGMTPWRHQDKTEKWCEIIGKRKSDNLKSCLASSNGECTIPHDGLDSFLHKNGVFGVFADIDAVSAAP